MRLTTKGQVTVPKHVRDSLGIGPGSEVDFVHRGGEFVLTKLDAHRNETRGQALVRHIVDTAARLRAEGRINDLTTEEIMEMTRGPFDDVDAR